MLSFPFFITLNQHLLSNSLNALFVYYSEMCQIRGKASLENETSDHYSFLDWTSGNILYCLFKLTSPQLFVFPCKLSAEGS